MTILVSFVVGCVVASLTWWAVRPLFRAPTLLRDNYRGRTIPTAAGIVIPIALLATAAGRAVAEASGIGSGVGLTEPWLLVLLATGGFTLFGFVDDLIGTSQQRGFRGHLGSLFRGRPTTGVLKLAGGACVALSVVAPLAGTDLLRLFADAAVVALAANVGNLLDRAPGRAIKGSLIAFGVLVAAAGFDPALAPVAAVLGAGAGLLVDDLREHLMIGDSGSNCLGAVIGLGAVLTLSPWGRNLALLLLVAINAAGELVSFSSVIDAFPPLRLLDRAGRRQ